MLTLWALCVPVICPAGQGAIAAKPSATYKGYLLGGLCWVAVPFTMATSMGLGARAMNLPISLDESNAGLVPPAVATVLMGAGGGFLLVFQVGSWGPGWPAE